MRRLILICCLLLQAVVFGQSIELQSDGNISFKTKTDSGVVTIDDNGTVTTLQPVTDDGTYRTYTYNHSGSNHYYLSGTGSYLDVQNNELEFFVSNDPQLVEVNISDNNINNDSFIYPINIKKIIAKNAYSEYSPLSPTYGEGIEYLDVSNNNTWYINISAPKSIVYLDVSNTDKLQRLDISGTKIQKLISDGLISTRATGVSINIVNNPDLHNIKFTGLVGSRYLIITNNNTLENIDFNFGDLSGDGVLISSNPLLESLKLSGSFFQNSSSTVNVRMNPKLSTINLLNFYGSLSWMNLDNNALTNISFPTSSLTVSSLINLSHNRLTSNPVPNYILDNLIQPGRPIDTPTEFIYPNLDLSYNYIQNGDLLFNHDIPKLMPYLGYNEMNIATLPDNILQQYYIRYQPRYVIPQTTFAIGQPIDLSSQLYAKGNTGATQTTNYQWRNFCGTVLAEGYDYTVSNGVTTFLRPSTGKVFCVMSTAAYPDLKSYDGTNKDNIKGEDPYYRTTEVNITYTPTACLKPGTIVYANSKISGCTVAGLKNFSVGAPLTIANAPAPGKMKYDASQGLVGNEDGKVFLLKNQCAEIVAALPGKILKTGAVVYDSKSDHFYVGAATGWQMIDSEK